MWDSLPCSLVWNLGLGTWREGSSVRLGASIDFSTVPCGHPSAHPLFFLPSTSRAAAPLTWPQPSSFSTLRFLGSPKVLPVNDPVVRELF